MGRGGEGPFWDHFRNTLYIHVYLLIYLFVYLLVRFIDILLFIFIATFICILIYAFIFIAIFIAICIAIIIAIFIIENSSIQFNSTIRLNPIEPLLAPGLRKRRRRLRH